MARGDPEDLLHIEAVRRLVEAPTKIWFFHCPNERMCPPQHRSHLRLLGQVRGVPDICVESPARLSPSGCRVEFKRPGINCRLSKDQAKWKAFYDSIGKPWLTTDCIDEFTEWMQGLGYDINEAPKGYVGV